MIVCDEKIIHHKLILHLFIHHMQCDVHTIDTWPSRIGQVSPPIHPLTSSQGAVFLVNSWQGYFRCGPSLLLKKGKPYSKVTAAFLPSSLGDSHSFALLYSSWSPVSVCGTDHHIHNLESFLGSVLCTIYMGEPTHLRFAWTCVLRICLEYILTNIQKSNNLLYILPFVIPSNIWRVMEY